MALSVNYGLPAMFTVTSQPLRRQRHAVVSEIPACWQNLCKLIIGLPVMLTCDVMFTPQDTKSCAMSQESAKYR